MDKQLQNERVKRIAQHVLSLPALPTIVAKMVELIDDPRTSANTITKLISEDQVLTSRILKLANSVYYGMVRKIGTVQLAIVVLGFDMVRQVGLSSSIISRFKERAFNPNFDMSRFWEHSIACGVIGKALAKEQGYKEDGEVFVAGLLHDIGKLILNQYFPREFNGIMDRVKDKNVSFRQAELEELGVGHAMVGSWLAEKWTMPDQLVECIKLHHLPDDAKVNPELTSIVHFADHLCKWREVGNSGDNVVPRLSSTTFKFVKAKLKDDGVDYDYYGEFVDAEIEKAGTFINLVQGKPIPDSE